MKKRKNSGTNKIYLADNINILRAIPDGSIDLIYIDPPFNTGKYRQKTTIKVSQSSNGDRIGFQDKLYDTRQISKFKYADDFKYYISFLKPRLLEAHRILEPTGSLFFHIDYREAHYCKVLLDGIFDRSCFQNEIIWAYDYGGRSKKRWPTKHDTILWYSKDPKVYTFNYEELPRIPYMAPGLVGKEKAARGKTPTDVWWHTIVPTNGKEKTGYPTQKPLGVLTRIVSVHSRPGETVLDFFAGSGTTGEAAALLGRQFILVDDNKEAVKISAKRLKQYKPEHIGF
jgi:site-specific DNA-methyltransferase (adenine-specific)